MVDLVVITLCAHRDKEINQVIMLFPFYHQDTIIEYANLTCLQSHSGSQHTHPP